MWGVFFLNCYLVNPGTKVSGYIKFQDSKEAKIIIVLCKVYSNVLESVYSSGIYHISNPDSMVPDQIKTRLILEYFI